MLRLNILNLKGFLKVVNECEGAVKLLYPDGTKKDINKQFEIQSKLLEQHDENQSCSHLILEVRNPEDYYNIVAYYAGDC